MSTTGRAPTDADAASDIAAQLREAGFVRLFANADGDSLAASGVLARALDDRSSPFQVSVVETREAYARRRDRLNDETLVVSVGIGAEGSTAETAPTIRATDRPASVTAFDVARELGSTADAVLALAGAASSETVGAGETAPLLEAARENGVERRPGVGSPVDDLSDGLAHSTLFHAPFSGDPGAVQAALAEIDLPAEQTPTRIDASPRSSR
ncbi:hypothetical protein ACFQH2_12490 [Natronoarchaeum sp. GCM10025703]|uniref:hypothetical protein n=1 Tax=Natronoarchaeum sp. GCM10025703 TaxID=3252685 RepID=UPI00361A4D25